MLGLGLASDPVTELLALVTAKDFVQQYRYEMLHYPHKLTPKSVC